MLHRLTIICCIGALQTRLQVKLMAALVLAGTSTEGLSKPGKLAAISR